MRIFAAVLGLVAAFSFGAESFAADAQTAQTLPNSGMSLNNKQILKGLTQVAVHIAPLDDWLTAHSVTPAQLKSAAATKLQSSGLAVVQEPPEKPLGNNLETPPSVPILYVRFKSIPESKQLNFGAYTAQLSLVDSVTTKRNAHELMVALWDTTDVGNLKPNMSDELNWALNQQLDNFLRDWKTANQ